MTCNANKSIESTERSAPSFTFILEYIKKIKNLFLILTRKNNLKSYKIYLKQKNSKHFKNIVKPKTNTL
jgi:hypothetical protein